MSASIRRLTMAALLLSLLALPLPARPAGEPSPGSGTLIVLPGDPRLDGNRVVPHRATWRVTINDADGGSTVQGQWTDTWVRSEADGRPVMEFRTQFVDPLGEVLVDNETVSTSRASGPCGRLKAGRRPAVVSRTDSTALPCPAHAAREWTLVDWQLHAAVPAGEGSQEGLTGGDQR